MLDLGDFREDMQVQIIETCGDLICGLALFILENVCGHGRLAGRQERQWQCGGDGGEHCHGEEEAESHEESGQRGSLEQWR